MAHHDGLKIRMYWREYNKQNTVDKPIVEPKETEEPKNNKVGITFDIREDYIELLEEEGYTSDSEVLEAGRETILAINGIGKATVDYIFSTNREE